MRRRSAFENYQSLFYYLTMSYQIGQVKEYLAIKKFDTPPSIGLRINPVVGGGQISAMSTATKFSKFGLPLMDDSRESLLQAMGSKLKTLKGTCC